MGNWRFGAFPKLPYSTMQQLNLDWILDRIRRFLPDTGTKGQVLTRTKDGAAWADPEAASGAVSSVNGKTGAVVLDAEDVGALPDSYTAPVTSVNGQTGDVSLNLGVTSIRADYEGSGTVGVNTGDVSLVGLGCLVNTIYPGRVQVSASKSTIGLGSVANERQYSAQNPPPYPVTSVNGQTGAVTIQTGGSPLDAYPVGSIYMSVNSTSPATLFGGTWERIQDMFLLAAGTAYAAGSTGGEAAHTLTIDEMPSHNHGFKRTTSTTASGSTWARISSTGDAVNDIITNTGGGHAHNNMPPYLAVYMWKRTA